MRIKSTEIMEQILEFAKEFIRNNGRSPYVREIAEEIGIGKGTAYSYLTAMRDRGMIAYDGKNISNDAIDKINHEFANTPLVGRVVCGNAVEEESAVEEYVDLPTSIFGSGEKFILKAYGDSMNLAGIDEGDLLVVRKQNTADEGELVIALIDGVNNNCKRLAYDRKAKAVVLKPESTNPVHTPHKYRADELQIQGVVTHIIKSAK